MDVILTLALNEMWPKFTLFFSFLPAPNITLISVSVSVKNVNPKSNWIFIHSETLGKWCKYMFCVHAWPRGCKLFPSLCRKNPSVRLADVASVYLNTEQGSVIQIQVVTRDTCYCWMSTDRLRAVHLWWDPQGQMVIPGLIRAWEQKCAVSTPSENDILGNPDGF